MKILIVVTVVIILAALGLAALIRSAEPAGGLENGRLKSCPDTPNCVFTGDANSGLSPLRFGDDVGAARDRIKEIMQDWPRATLVEEEDGYLHYTIRSAWFRFVDDLEYWFDRDTGDLHIRSASRLGHSDLGVNRARVEQIQRAWSKK